MNLFQEKRESSPEVHAKEVLRILFIGLIGLIVILGFVLRLVQLQVWNRDVYETRSRENRIDTQYLAPPRGRILDRNGIVLADTRSVLSLGIVVERTPDLGALLEELRDIIDLSDSKIDQFWVSLSQARRPMDAVLLKSDLTDTEVATLAVNRYRYPSIEVMRESVRLYRYGELFAHAIGSVRRISKEDLPSLDGKRYSQTRFIGRHGVERVYEEVLHGEIGIREVEVDVRGHVVDELSVQPQTPGMDCTLYLDFHLQEVAFRALGDRRGAVVAMDPNTGGVLALVSKPSYDPNLFISGLSAEKFNRLTNSTDLPLFNRALQGLYAPGSTFKPVVGLAALTHGLLTWEDTLTDNGEFRLPGSERIYRDWSWRPDYSGGQGEVDLYRAIFRSSNVFFYEMGYRLGIDKLAPFAAQFGLGQVLTVDIFHAKPGVLPDREWKQSTRGENWLPGDTVNVSIGQGDLLVTPLHVASVAAALALKGNRVRPRMVKADSPRLEDLGNYEPLPPVMGPSERDWNLMTSAMEAVVHRGDMGYGNNGIAWSHIGQGLSYRFAGKSGTAQVVAIEQGREYEEEELPEHLRKHAWFMGFAPAEDPKIAVAVLVENGGGGSPVAGPIARAVIDAYLSVQGAITKAG